MKIDSTISALDATNDILDMTIGIAETLRLKASDRTPEDDDYVARMLSGIAYQQADRLMELSSYLDRQVQELRDKQNGEQND